MNEMDFPPGPESIGRADGRSVDFPNNLATDSLNVWFP